MESLKNLLNSLSQIFSYEKYNQEFLSYIKQISKPNNQICNKRIPNGEGGYKCLDCEIDSLSLICSDCYNKGKNNHKDHKIIFNQLSHGYCDCGDFNCLKKEGFCPNHKGTFQNEESLFNYIKLCFNDNQINSINLILDKIFLLVLDNIINLNSNENDEEEKEINENKMFDLINFLLNLFMIFIIII